jgi:competence ComEA-like helix-hairpin-helix protein
LHSGKAKKLKVKLKRKERKMLRKIKKILPIAILALATLLSLARASAQATAQADDDPILPDGPGRDAVEAACTVCHTTGRIVRQKLTVDQWRSTLREMIENGASLNPDQWDPVVAYLARNFGPAPVTVNANTASVQELADTLQLTAAEAQAIVAWRIANGTFKDLADLKKVPGLPANKIEAQKDKIGF